MPRFFIHVRDGDRFYGDGNGGVAAPGISALLPQLRRTVREIIDGEGGPSMTEARVCEVMDRSGVVVQVLPFVTAYARH